MAEAFGVAAGALTVIELTAKLISQCKHLIETTRDAPQDLNRILVEIASLKAALESLHYLSSAGSEFSDNVRRLEDAEGAVKGCEDAVTQLAAELDGLVLGSQSAPKKREKIQNSLKWCFKESKARKLLDDILQHKTTITLTLLGEVT
jgi:predicted  nucleic acid-binding Zn-ribbon protein